MRGGSWPLLACISMHPIELGQPITSPIWPIYEKRSEETSENAVNAKFAQPRFRRFRMDERKAGPLQEGGIRSARLFSKADCNTGEETGAYRKCVIFHREGAWCLCYHTRFRVGRYIWRGRRRTLFVKPIDVLRP
jgi:hypothetical protein